MFSSKGSSNYVNPNRRITAASRSVRPKYSLEKMELPNGESERLKVRSIVGLIPLFAVTTIEPELLNRLPAFKE
jgi:hypothetical protein